MRDIDRVFMLRQNIIDDWRFRRMTWQEITYKYRVSKSWFYKLRRRFLTTDFADGTDFVCCCEDHENNKSVPVII